MERKRNYKRRGRRVKKTKKQRFRQMLFTLILVGAFATFAVSAFQLLDIFKGYNEGESEYNEIAEIAITTNKGDKKDEEEFRVDFDALRKINKDVIGWIRFEEPAVINYPIVQGKDNDEYLHKTFKGYDNTVGTLFVDYRNKDDFSDGNTMIYGHYMYNGTMFNELDSYKDEEFWKKHPYFYVYTPDGKELKYHVYSAGVIKDTAENYNYKFESDEEFMDFLDLTRDSSNYDTGVGLNAKSQVLTLSTCTKNNNDERFVVHAVKKEERSMKNE